MTEKSNEIIDENIFYVNDLNFNGYNSEQLKALCEYKLPLVTNFPKLVTCLYISSKLKKLIIHNDIVMTKEEIIECLLNAIKLKTQNANGKTIINKISMIDSDLWKTIIEIFTKHNKKSKSTIIVKRKKTMKKQNTKEVNIAI